MSLIAVGFILAVAGFAQEQPEPIQDLNVLH
jgi:hypothetical protein